jgi:FtsH-binding integral membrane protein
MRIPIPEQPRTHRLVNLGALLLAVIMAGLGLMRLVSVLTLNETLLPRPMDGWLMMSLRLLAVLFALWMFLASPIRKSFTRILGALVLLTLAGIGSRLASLLPADLHATAGLAQLILVLAGLGVFILGLLQGEDLAGFYAAIWVKTNQPDHRK